MLSFALLESQSNLEEKGSLSILKDDFWSNRHSSNLDQYHQSYFLSKLKSYLHPEPLKNKVSELISHLRLINILRHLNICNTESIRNKKWALKNISIDCISIFAKTTGLDRQAKIYLRTTGLSASFTVLDLSRIIRKLSNVMRGYDRVY